MMARTELEEENSHLKNDIGCMHRWARAAISSLQQIVVTLCVEDIVPEAIVDNLHRLGCYRVKDVQKWTQTQLFDAGFDLNEVSMIERGLEQYGLCLYLDLYDPEKRQVRLEGLLKHRTFRCLMKRRIDTLGKLQECTERDLLDIRNFGRKSLNEVVEKLAEYGMKLKEQVAVDDLHLDDQPDDDWLNPPADTHIVSAGQNPVPEMARGFSFARNLDKVRISDILKIRKEINYGTINNDASLG